jgi:hypothetical protein
MPASLRLTLNKPLKGYVNSVVGDKPFIVLHEAGQMDDYARIYPSGSPQKQIDILEKSISNIQQLISELKTASTSTTSEEN